MRLVSASRIALRSLLDWRAHSGVTNLCKMLQEDLQNCSKKLTLNHTDHDGTGPGSVAAGNAGCGSHCNSHQDTVLVDHLVNKLQSCCAAAAATAAAENIVQ